MLKSVGAKYTLVGHSDNRSEGDTDEMLKNKIRYALKNNFNSAEVKKIYITASGGPFINLPKKKFDKIKRGVSRGSCCYKRCWKQHMVLVTGFQQKCCCSATNVAFSSNSLFLHERNFRNIKKQHFC